jgi:hypothetical protein
VTSSLRAPRRATGLGGRPRRLDDLMEVVAGQ